MSDYRNSVARKQWTHDISESAIVKSDWKVLFFCNLHVSQCAHFVALQIAMLYSISTDRLQTFLQDIQCYRRWWKVNLTFHKNRKRNVEGVQIWRGRRQGIGPRLPNDPSGSACHERFHPLLFVHKLALYRTEHNNFFCLHLDKIL